MVKFLFLFLREREREMVKLLFLFLWGEGETISDINLLNFELINKYLIRPTLFAGVDHPSF